MTSRATSPSFASTLARDVPSCSCQAIRSLCYPFSGTEWRISTSSTTTKARIGGQLLFVSDDGYLVLADTRFALHREIPYSPSFTVDFSALDPRIRNVKDMVFLPGFHSPTIAILYSERLSWEK